MTTCFSSQSESLHHVTHTTRALFQKGGAKSLYYCFLGPRHSSGQKAQSKYVPPKSKSKLIPGEGITGQETGRLKARSGTSVFFRGF